MAASTVKGSFEIKTSHIFHETAINEHLCKQYELKLFRWNDNVSECNSKWKVGLTTTNVSKIDGTVVDKKIESDFGISASNFEKVTTIFKQLRNFVEREVQETYNSGTAASTFDSYHNHLMERLKIKGWIPFQTVPLSVNDKTAIATGTTNSNVNQFYTHEIVNFLNNVKSVREKDELIIFFTKPTEERINSIKAAFKKTKKKEEELRLRYLLSLVNLSATFRRVSDQAEQNFVKIVCLNPVAFKDLLSYLEQEDNIISEHLPLSLSCNNQAAILKELPGGPNEALQSYMQKISDEQFQNKSIMEEELPKLSNYLIKKTKTKLVKKVEKNADDENDSDNSVHEIFTTPPSQSLDESTALKAPKKLKRKYKELVSDTEEDDEDGDQQEKRKSLLKKISKKLAVEKNSDEEE